MLVALLAFVVAASLVVLLPGPDTLVVVRGMMQGRRRGTTTALGNLTGLSVWIVITALGLAAVLRASEIGYDVLRVAGGAYLIWLGVQAWRHRGEGASAPSGRTSLLGTGYVAGLTTNLLNPKVGVFFVTFLPGFVPSGDPVGPMSLMFGSLFLLLTALYWLVLLALSTKVTGWMNAPKVRRKLDAITALVLVGFGISLVADA